MQLKSLFVLAFMAISFGAFSQGTIRGKITDKETGEELIGATAQIVGTTKGAVTDFEGNYAITSMAAGLYDIQISFVSYQTQKITGVEVKDGDVTILDVALATDVQQLEEIVVTAEVIKNSEAALTSVKRKSANMLDGISSQSFRKIGDSDAASAIKRVPGVSIQGGKYVYVRGLGDRYTKSVLNGMDIPGLDPDRNTLQMDIFPTNLIDNMIISKSFTADLPADFTGGVVNIETKDFPEEKVLKVSGSLGYNPGMHFNNDYLTYEGGDKDFLGFDDGTRDMPVDFDTYIPSISENNAFTTVVTRRFNPTLAAMRDKSMMDYGFGISAGNQISGEKLTWGYTASGAYKNSTKFYEEAQYNSFVKPDELELFELRPNRTQSGSLGSNNVLLSGLVGGAVKTKRSKYAIKLMHLQNGESRAGYFSQSTFISGSVSLYKDNLEYSERAITNGMISGKHTNDDGSWQVEWKFAPTHSTIEDKDVRSTPYRVDDGNYRIEPSEAGSPTRIWRNLDEWDYAAKTDATREYQIFGNPAKLKFGLGYTDKQRDYEIFNYRLLVKGQNKLGFTGDANELLSEENIWDVQTDIGSSMSGNYEVANTYSANQRNAAIYVSNEFNVVPELKAVLGVRAEKYEQYYTGMDQLASIGDTENGILYDNEKVLDLMNLFPSVNLIYAMTDAANLRVSYSRTTARPSFKEASIAQIFDPITGRTFIGGLITDPAVNPNPIRESYISNFDVRWETFQKQGQTVSASLFYKQFQDPIELVTFDDSAPDNFQPRNMGDAQVYGLELEARKNLSFITPSLSAFSLNTNISVIQSRLKMDKREGGEYEFRQNNARVGEEIEDTREMQGQAPYIINAGVSYAGFNNGIDASLYYNVQGKKLAVVGSGAAPDVYDVPFHSLNMKINKSFGEEEKMQVGLGIQNILGDKLEQKYESFNSSDKIYSFLDPGRSFSLNFSYTF